MIIFDEKKYVEEIMFKDGFELNNMIIKNLGILAKYYVYQGVDRDKISLLLEKFVIEHNMEYCPYTIYIDKAMKIADRYNLEHNRKVYITENELKFIKEFNNNTIERIAFVMLVMNKFLGHKVKLNIHDIQRYTKQNLDYDTFYKYYKIITDNKNVSRYKNTYKIKHDSKSPISMIITDFDNMIIEYLKTCKTKEYVYCECCGIKVKRKGKRDKYCEKCLYKRQLNWSKKYKEKLKKDSFIKQD